MLAYNSGLNTVHLRTQTVQVRVGEQGSIGCALQREAQRDHGIILSATGH
jgi:hypothetical protein